MTTEDDCAVPASTDEDAAGTQISDAELTALALAADPHAPLDPAAVPIAQYLGAATAPLPEWYMAPVTTHRLGHAGRLVVLAVVTAFVLIEAFGLCSTYGQLPFH